MSTMQLEMIVRARDQASAALRSVLGALRETANNARLVRTSLGGFAGSGAALAGATRPLVANLANARREAAGLMRTLGGLALGGGGVGYAFKRGFLDVASSFEKYEATLESVLKDQQLAKEALKWASEFARTTPYEMGEVTDAFVKMVSYGIKPTNGSLKAAGDAASAMGKPLTQAVEAMADAMTGENERLKEFGITASTAGNKITYTWTENGKQLSKTVDKSNRAMIQSTITAIWNGQFGGAMERRARTWDGMMSNLADSWSRFALQVMQMGVFDKLKGELEAALTWIEKAFESGELTAFALEWTLMFESIIDGLKEAGLWIATELPKWYRGFIDVKEAVGGWGPIFAALGVLLGGAFIQSLAMTGIALVQFGGVLWAKVLYPLGGLLLAKAAAAISVFNVLAAVVVGVVKTIGAAILATPLGWLMLAIAALAGAVYVVYQNWDGIVQWFEAKVAAVRAAFDQGIVAGFAEAFAQFNPVTLVAQAIDGLVQYLFGIDLAAAGRRMIQSLIDGVRSLLPDLEAFVAPLRDAAAFVGRVTGLGGGAPKPMTGAGAPAQTIDNNLHIRIDAEGRPAVEHVSAGRGGHVDLSLGYAAP